MFAAFYTTDDGRPMMTTSRNQNFLLTELRRDRIKFDLFYYENEQIENSMSAMLMLPMTFSIIRLVEVIFEELKREYFTKIDTSGPNVFHVPKTRT